MVLVDPEVLAALVAQAVVESVPREGLLGTGTPAVPLPVEVLAAAGLGLRPSH